jgi:hypothetical protein
VPSRVIALSQAPAASDAVGTKNPYFYIDIIVIVIVPIIVTPTLRYSVQIATVSNIFGLEIAYGNVLGPLEELLGWRL